ncbi:NAD(P)-dependent oxidoreductase [Ferrimonas sediminicola]|uniref:NAD(P)-dependent oxidoreductase n=1 Tax=Ferrimonas sediminicola TaxID=2569538 RepID=A0A4U1BF52_9GAMM|nr:NAD(P)-dependent oxidoreductase [Ferrimonas sediminicola]TKB48990.1 NAD(P)-dependent oxidoreductase [Ferrimonas sediminicola]
MAKVAFIGLGVMGYPMAGHLQRAGHDVTVYNRTTAKAQRWQEQYGGSYTLTPRDAAQGCELVFVCVGNDDDLRQVVAAKQGALMGMEAGSLLVDHTTASADVARELAEVAAERGVAFIDAPVSGGQAGAENGALTVMAGGEPEQFERVRPVLEAYAKCAELMGPAGSGQLCKMVNQICIAGVVQGLAEGMHFAQKAGLDGDRVLGVIGKGAAQSWQMDNRGHTMLRDEYEFGFAVDWMRKDLGITLDEARRNGAQLPLTALVDQFYAEVQRLGGSRMDTSSLKLRLPK